MQGKSKNPYYVAQGILARRDHSTAELRTKLARKGFSPAVVAETVSRLEQQHLLDDLSFARRYAFSTLERTAVGSRYLRQKLQQKGIAAPQIETVLAEVAAAHPEALRAARAAASWRQSHARHRDDQQRLVRFLQSRGFSFDVMSEVLASPSD